MVNNKSKHLEHEEYCLSELKYNVGFCLCDFTELVRLIDDDPVDEERLIQIRRRLRFKQKELEKRIEGRRNRALREAKELQT